ncbi:MAG: V-type ATP synthase subunit A, partial [Spirochaetales bacterium]|nr:V-type ATP synthase subunit A [Spirochaetales bacterium]
MNTGKIVGINGNMATVEFTDNISQNEVGYIILGENRLKAEVIRINGNQAAMQVFEMTNGIGVGDDVEFTGELLSVDLGPGLLSQVYDGLQNPLPELAEKCGFFLQRGVYMNAIPDTEWEFTPQVKVGDKVKPAYTLGLVPEGIFQHRIMVPFGFPDEEFVVKKIVPKGLYSSYDEVAVVTDPKGIDHPLTMIFTWPIKKPIRNYEERLKPVEPLNTTIRIIDTFLPVARGGTFCIPGPFGAGKTVLQ